ncbi:hypothetical protein TNCV_3430451 [Trichonephila clavipes]|nr:hypothetical protein TNCV_3430451 [Trichonephila clavipes]
MILRDEEPSAGLKLTNLKGKWIEGYKWSESGFPVMGYGIDSKQVVLTPGFSAKFATGPRHLHRMANCHSVHDDIGGQRLLGFLSRSCRCVWKNFQQERPDIMELKIPVMNTKRMWTCSFQKGVEMSQTKLAQQIQQVEAVHRDLLRSRQYLSNVARVSEMTAEFQKQIPDSTEDDVGRLQKEVNGLHAEEIYITIYPEIQNV